MSIPQIKSYELPDATAFPSNKAPWQIDPDRSVLLIHDMQRYFLSFYGDSSPLVSKLIANLIQLKRRCKGLGIPTIYTTQPVGQSSEERGLLNDMWGPGLDRRPDLKDVVAPLAPEKDDLVLTKWRYSAFQKSDLESIMTEAGKSQLLIGGVYGHIGCLMTAANAFMLNIKAFIVGDAIADFSLDDHLFTLKYTSSRCGNVISLEKLEDL